MEVLELFVFCGDALSTERGMFRYAKRQPEMKNSGNAAAVAKDACK